MSYFVSWTYGPGYFEIFLDLLSLIMLSDLLALLILLWMCWRTRKKKMHVVSEGYENVTATSSAENHEEVFAEKVTALNAKSSIHSISSSSRLIEKTESSTQTKEKEVKDQQTLTKPEPAKSSVSVQTTPVENLGGVDVDGGSGENQENWKTDEELLVEKVTTMNAKTSIHAFSSSSPPVEKTDSSSQTKDKEVKDQQTGTKPGPAKSSVSVQTTPVENIGGIDVDGGSGENQLESKDDDTQALVRPPLMRRKSRDNITFMSGWRRRVKLTEIMRARLILETRVEELEREEVTEDEIERELAPFLIGRYPIAGLLITDSDKKMTLYDAYKEGLITRGTAVSLLEAQAAVGSIIDPRNGDKVSVDEAKSIGIIDKKMASVLIRAERAVTGYPARATKETLSLFQAMKRNLVVESHGIRLLEAQIATGGIIDPQANMRLPVEVAFERGLFDEHLHRILEDPSDDTKGFLDPNSGDNLTYLELIQRCVEDEDTGLLLLPLVSEGERKDYTDKYANTSYTSSRSPSVSTRTFSSGSESVGALDDVTDVKL